MLNNYNAYELKIGRLAFEAYCKSVGGLTWDKKPIPGWDSEKMTDEVRRAWIEAAIAVNVEDYYFYT